jgi:hypothetical protein
VNRAELEQRLQPAIGYPAKTANTARSAAENARFFTQYQEASIAPGILMD